MPERTNSATEQAWADAWNDLCDLLGGITRYAIMLPNRDTVDRSTCQGWLQDAVYAGNYVALRRYKCTDQRYQIHVKQWPVGAPEPAWIAKTADGFVQEKLPTW